jgi:hypothetical protein
VCLFALTGEDIERERTGENDVARLTQKVLSNDATWQSSATIRRLLEVGLLLTWVTKTLK